MSGIQGINISSEIFSLANAIRSDRNNDISFLVMDFTDSNDSIVLDTWQMASRLGHDGLSSIIENELLPGDDVRYVLLNFEYISPNDLIQRNKHLFVLWAPDDAPVSKKIVATMNYHYVKEQIENSVGTLFSIQANDYDDLLYNRILASLKTKITCL